MIKINLLPFRAARKKENIRKQVSVFMLVLVFLSILLVWYHMSLNNKTQNLRVMISNTENELKKYNEINREIAEIKKQLQILTTKTEIIDELQVKRREPVGMLDAMTELIVAERMWFTSFRSTEKIQAEPSAPRGKPARGARPTAANQPSQKSSRVIDIHIKGIALDNKTVADFMTHLEMSPLFADVDLKAIKQVSIRGLNLMEFEVNFTKLPSEKQKGPYGITG